jgi:hypothetical protein
MHPAQHLHHANAEPLSSESTTTFLLNAQTLDALAFRVDVLSADSSSLLARCFVPWQTLAPLEGLVRAGLVTPDLRPAGTFHAAFLVVTALDHPANTLGSLQRSRWAPHAPTLDIGHRGSGASRVQGHSVRENTLLSFEQAALNLADFVEFDVHLSRDGEVVVHHGEPSQAQPSAPGAPSGRRLKERRRRLRLTASAVRLSCSQILR